MTNGDKIRNCTNEQLTCVFHNLRHTAIYSEAEGRRLLSKDNLHDFLLWLNKESEDIDSYIFDTVFQKLTLLISKDSYYDSIDINIPFYKNDEYIKSLFVELFGVEYNSNYCFYVVYE